MIMRRIIIQLTSVMAVDMLCLHVPREMGLRSMLAPSGFKMVLISRRFQHGSEACVTETSPLNSRAEAEPDRSPR
jgi:hypothetical protein